MCRVLGNLSLPSHTNKTRALFIHYAITQISCLTSPISDARSVASDSWTFEQGKSFMLVESAAFIQLGTL
jgi:hypothetical protein